MKNQRREIYATGLLEARRLEGEFSRSAGPRTRQALRPRGGQPDVTEMAGRSLGAWSEWMTRDDSVSKSIIAGCWVRLDHSVQLGNYGRQAGGEGLELSEGRQRSVATFWCSRVHGRVARGRGDWRTR